MTTQTVRIEDIYAALKDVKDPEIPTVSVVDLGIIKSVSLSDNAVRITIIPTFVGCPALDYMQRDIRARIEQMGIRDVHVDVDLSAPWSSNMVSEEGRRGLQKHGLALPHHFDGEFDPEILLNAECPLCGSSNTSLRSPFGPTLCRALYFCNNCHQAFEQFKPV